MDARSLTVRAGPDGLEVVIPLRRMDGAIRLVRIATVAWACGEVVAIPRLLEASSGPGLVAAWVWTALAIWILSAWAFLMQAGNETIALRGNRLSIRRANTTVVYDAARIANLRRGEVVFDTWLTRAWGNPQLVFEYPGHPRGVRFAYGVADREAALIVSELAARLAPPPVPREAEG